ncbi:uncharacterized protein [Cicer arietinum]|uniref:uncharacterized protein n=1 Tax=Cicer arietinum TaxID=3827 RepID=UPI003CC5B4E3
MSFIVQIQIVCLDAELQNAKKSELWVIGKLNVPHTCTNYALSQDHTKLDSNMICQSIMQVVKVDPSIKVKEESYNQLPQWLLVMKTFAPGTKIEMETISAYHENSLINGIRIFHRLFWAFVLCISAFKFCKPIIQVDGTWLYDKYKGTLLVAIAHDENDNANICLISDRHESIKSAYNNPNNGWQDPPSKNMFCVRHISQNFTREFKDNALKKNFISIGYSINDPTYRYYRREIGMLNPEALKWLDNILRQDWSQAFVGGSRWGR